MAISKEKQKALEALQKETTKKFGKQVVFTGKEAMENGTFDRKIIPTPSIELNQALYCGGLSGIVELFGAPASGKTSLAIETLAKAQAEDPDFFGLWFETEGSIDKDILAQHGVDLDRMAFIGQEDVDFAEDGLDIVYGALVQNIPNMVIVNSVAGLLPKVEMESDLEKQNIGLTARMMSKLFRRITGVAAKNKVLLVFINQIRDNVGQLYGDPTTTPGGKALRFYSNQRIKMTAVKIKKEDPVPAEEYVKISCITHKNRLAGMHNPNTKCEYYASYEEGIDSTVSIPQALLDNDIFQKGGSWWFYPDKENVATIAGVECKFRSEKDLVQAIRDNEDFKIALLGMISPEKVSEEEKEAIDKEEKEIDNAMAKVDAELEKEE